MNEITVTNFQELKAAKENHADYIVVVGSFAKQLIQAKKIATLSAASIAALTAAIGAAVVGLSASVFTGGASAIISAAAATPLAMATGLSVPTIVFLASLGVGGVAVIVALFKEYTVEISHDQTKIIFHK